METPQDIRKMVPIIKIVSNACNMRCLYCYYHLEDQGEIKVMSEKVLTELIAKTLAFSDLDPVQFIWHGGEPMLAGMDLYKRILSIEEGLQDGKKIENHIQTNATLISKEWAEFFAQNKFEVGISLDGPEEVQNSCRVFSNGQGSFRTVMIGLERLHDVNIYPSAIALVTRASLGQERKIFDFFANAGIKRFLLKPCYELSPTGEPTKFSVSPREFSQFMIGILEVWLERDDPSISIRNLAQMMVGIVGGKPSLCEFSGKCWLCPKVEFDGIVGPCDSLSHQSYKFGNIADNTWEEIFQSKVFFQLLSGLQKSRSLCSGCEWLKNCHNHCPKYSYSEKNGAWVRNIFCDAKKEIFLRLRQVIESV